LGAPEPRFREGVPKTLFALVFTFVTAALSAAPLEQEMRDVERIRGLRFDHPVRTVTVHRDDLPRLLRGELVKSMPYSPDDYELVLTTLRLVQPSAEPVLDKMIELLQGQVLAFYDPLSHTYYAIDRLPDTATPLDSELIRNSVVLHELTHALQDQRFGIGERDFALRNDWDASLAYHSLMEGDASLVMMAAVADTAGQKLDDLVANPMLINLLTSGAAAEKTIDPSAPRYFVESLKFPYIDGLKFVIAAYRRGGWKAVDAVYANPPRSTREIIHPEEYFARTAPTERFVMAPPAPAPRLLTVEHLGEFHWAFLLGADAAKGWIADRVAISQDERCDPTVLVETKWESPARAAAFREAYAALLRDDRSARVVQEGSVVRAAYGADLALIDQYLP